MRARVLLTAVPLMAALLSLPFVANAQTTAPAKALDATLSELEHELVPAAKAMPAEKYSFAPSATTFAATQGADFVGVRTFAQQVAHLAGANYYFFSSVMGTKPDVDLKAISQLTDKDKLVAALIASFAYAHKAIATITTENAWLTVKPVDGQDTRVTIAAFGVAHGFDHYGQIVEYLRMNGLKPPASM